MYVGAKRPLDVLTHATGGCISPAYWSTKLWV